jgi:putative ATPase
MHDLGYGKGYKYAHDFKEKTTDMQCLPDNLKNRQYYFPSDEGFEEKVKQKLLSIRKIKNRY